MSRLQLGLTREQLIARRDGIGGSDAGAIMSGDWQCLWLEKTGRAEVEDLSGNLPVMMGCATEPFNLHWFEQTTGRAVFAEGETRIHPDYPWMRCTLDGMTDFGATVIQCKHVNAYSKIDEIVARYTPQVTHEMLICGVEAAVLSVFIGTMTYEAVPMALDWIYASQLIEREREFWTHVVNDEPPEQVAPIAAPVPPTKWRQFDLAKMKAAGEAWPNWAYAMQADLASWLDTAPAAKRNAAAAKTIKDLLPDDVNRLTYAGVAVTRSKTLAVTIKEEKSNGRA